MEGGEGRNEYLFAGVTGEESGDETHSSPSDSDSINILGKREKGGKSDWKD
jgi:hypothetical protein